MNIADLIQAIQSGMDPNQAILAAGQQQATSDTPPLPQPRPNIPSAPPPPQSTTPQGATTPVTDPIAQSDAPRVMKSPPDLANMYLQLMRDSANARSLDSGLSLMAAGLSKYPENRAALIAGAMKADQGKNITSEDIARLQKMQLDSQALQIRQAAKAGLMKKYGLDRDTVDYLDASGKLDEVVQHKNTQNLVHVETPEGTAFYDPQTGKKVVDIGGPKTETQTVEDKATGQTILIDKRTGKPIGAPIGGQQPVTGVVVKDEATGQTILTNPQTGQPIGAPIGGQKPVTGVHVTDAATGQTILVNPQTGQPIGAPIGGQKPPEGVLATGPQGPQLLDKSTGKPIGAPIGVAPSDDLKMLAVINEQRKAAGMPEISGEDFLKLRHPGQATNIYVGDDGTSYPKPPEGQDYLRNPATGKVAIGADGKPKLYTISGSSTELKDQKTQAETTKLTQEQLDKQKKENLSQIQKSFAATNVGEAVDSALELYNKPGVTGLGSDVWRQLAPGGSPVRTYDAKVSVVDANNVVNALRQMRESSSTGGALGQVSDFEDKLLRSTVASLNHNQDPKEVAKSLIRIKAAMQVMATNKYEDGDAAKFNRDLAQRIDELTIEHLNKKNPTLNVRRVN